MGWFQDLFKTKEKVNAVPVKQFNAMPFTKKVEAQRNATSDKQSAQSGIVSPVPNRQAIVPQMEPVKTRTAMMDALDMVKQLPKKANATYQGLLKGILQVKPTPTPMPTKAPMPTPTPVTQPFRFDPKTVGVKIPAPYTFTPPTGVFADALRKNFPNEATQSAVVGWAENVAKPFDPNGYNFNTPGDKRVTPGFEGTGDYGQMQINNGTMKDYIRRMPEIMANIGISSAEDLKDPYKAAAFSALIKKYQGWGAWKGWQNKGVTGL